MPASLKEERYDLGNTSSGAQDAHKETEGGVLVCNEIDEDVCGAL